MCLDAIFGSKKKTEVNQTQSQNQTVTPTVMPGFQPGYDWLSSRITGLGEMTPEQMVAALTPEQSGAISGVSSLVNDPTFRNRIMAAIQGAGSGTAGALKTLDGAIPQYWDSSGMGAANGSMASLMGGADPRYAAALAGPGTSALDGNRVDSNIRPDMVSAGMVSPDMISAPGAVSAGMVPTNFAAERVGTSPIGTSDIMGRMSPYIQSVINPAMESLDLQQAMQSSQSRARRAGQRAFGDMGERAALMEQYLQGLQRNEVGSKLYQSGYESAAGLAQADEARALQAASMNQGAGLSAQGLTLQGSQANQQAALTAGLAGKDAELRAMLSNQSTGLQGQLANQQAGMQASLANQGAGLQAAGMNQSGQQMNMQALLNILGMQQSGAGQLAGLSQQGLTTAGGMGLQQQGIYDTRQNNAAQAALSSAGMQGQLSQGNASLMGQLAGQDYGQQLTGLNALMQAGGARYDVNQRTLQAPWTQLSNLASTVYGAPLGQTGSSTGTMSGTTTQTSRPSLFDIGSGMATAISGMKFKGGGRVSGYAAGGSVGGDASPYWRRYPQPGYARGGYMGDDEDEPPIPALMPSGRYQLPDYENGRPANSRMAGYDAAGVAALTPEGGGGGVNQDQPVYDPVAATDRNPIRRPWLGGSPQDLIDVPTRREPAALVEGDSEMSPTQMQTIMGVPMRDDRPRSGASSTADLMTNTLSALATPRKRSFADKVSDFMNRDSTVEGFAMFSPAWAAKRDSRDAREALTAKLALELTTANRKRVDDLSMHSDKMALERVKIDREFGGGKFTGQSEFAQTGNVLTDYAIKVQRGEPTTPEEDMRYNYAYSQAAQPKIFNTPDGRTITQPPIDLSQYPKPKGGTAALTPGATGMPGSSVIGTEPMTTVNAAAVAGIEQAKKDINDVKSALFVQKPDGLKLKRAATASGGLPFTDARTARQAIKRAVEVLLRLRTGAAAPENEVEAYTDMYAPSFFDTDDGAAKKISRLDEFYKEVERLTANARSNVALKPSMKYDPATGDFVN